MRAGSTAMRFARISFAIDTPPPGLPLRVILTMTFYPRSATARLILNYDRSDEPSRFKLTVSVAIAIRQLRVLARTACIEGTRNYIGDRSRFGACVTRMQG